MNDDDLRRALDGLLEPLPPLGSLPPATARRATRRRQLKLGASATGGAGALVLAVTLALSATGTSESLVPPPVAGTPSPSGEPSTAPSSPAPRPTSDPPVLPSAPATPPAESEAPSVQDISVVLRPDGLGFTDGSSSSSLPFGTDAATVRAAVDRALLEGGEFPTPDCGSGSSTVQHENLFLLLQDGDFVGWGTGSPGLTTGDGIGIGTTLVELREALPGVVVTEGTLGPEWSTVEGGLAGFLDGTDDGSIVNSMAAGVRCLAR